VTGEIGQTGCAHDLTDGVIDWMEGKSQHYLVWAWWTTPCAPGNPTYGLITNYGTGAPTLGYGEGYRNRLATLVPSPTPTATRSVGGTPGPTAPTTSTPTPTATATPTPTSTGLGGRGFGISPAAGGVTLSWQTGVSQTGYLMIRLAGGELASLPMTWQLGPAVTSLVDPSAPLGIDCYLLLPLGTGPQAVSDLLCGVVGSGSAAGGPQNLTLRLNQSSTASFNWDPPPGGGQDSYLLMTLGGPNHALAGGATSASLPMTGPTCYLVGAQQAEVLQGYSDIVCGIPGVATLSP
jgi:hypothetical protein